MRKFLGGVLCSCLLILIFSLIFMSAHKGSDRSEESGEEYSNERQSC